MNTFLTRLLLVAFSVTCLVAVSVGQIEDRDAASAASGNLYVVSAKAGGTSYVEGGVTVMRSDGTAGHLLVGDYVEVGDKVSTGGSGRAEILMNPGSFLRMDKNSRFEFGSISLEDLRVNILSGTAIFEVFASDDFKVKVNAGDATFNLIKSGVYRVEVDAAGKARLEVRQGKALAGDLNAKTVKKNRAATVNGDSVAVSKFDKSKDDFEEWSEDRAKLIAKANERLVARNLGQRVMSSFQAYNWNCYDSIGLWVFNRQLSSFSFLPFGYGWRSPYGYRLRTNATTCDYPEEYWREPRVIYNPGSGSGGSGGGGGTTGVVPQENIDRGTRRQTPPFQRMQQTGGVKRISPNRFPTGSDFPSGSSPSRNRNSGDSSTKTEESSPPPPRRAPSLDVETKTKGDN